MPNNTDEGWGHLTANFQTGIAQNPEYYKSFWGRIDRVTVEDAVATSPNSVEATVTYYFANGEVSVERTLYRMVREDGELKIDDSEVLAASSR
jgi:eukaryotic-like serine/threonine-protein kinase